MRPRSPIPLQKVGVKLRVDLLARMRLFLHSDLEGRPPYGSISELVHIAIERELDRREQELKGDTPRNAT